MDEVGERRAVSSWGARCHVLRDGSSQGKRSQGCSTHVCSFCCCLATFSCSHRLPSESPRKYFPKLSSSRLDSALSHPPQQTAVMSPEISLSSPSSLHSLMTFSPAEFSGSSPPLTPMPSPYHFRPPSISP